MRVSTRRGPREARDVNGVQPSIGRWKQSRFYRSNMEKNRCLEAQRHGFS